MKGIPSTLSVGLMLLVGVGCAPTVHVTSLVSLDAVDSDQSVIEFLGEDALVRHPYSVLGQVFVEKRQFNMFDAKPTDEYLTDLMLEPASDLGADALIGFHSGLAGYDPRLKQKRYASALAVKFVDETTESETDRLDLVVCLLPLLRPDSSESTSVYDSQALDAARYQLEKRGYFAIVPSEAPSLTIQDLQSAEDDTLRAICGEQAGYVAIVSLDNEFLEVVVSAQLYSRIRRTVDWQGEDAESTVVGINIVNQDRRWAIHRALRDAFENLAPHYAEYGK